MGSRERFSPPVVGGSSLLIIFAVLCLSVFALLALSTVQADLRLSDASARAVEEYYDADTRAEEIFARLRAGEMPDGVTEEDGLFSYVCPISDIQQLYVQLRRDGEGWQVLCWQAVAETETETAEETGPRLWDGESILNEK